MSSSCRVAAVPPILSQGVNDRTMFHADNAYFYPAVKVRSRRLRTHTVSNTAFRGFGGPQGMVFSERMMEAIAIRTGLDALDVRKRNLYGKGSDITPYGMKVEDNIAPEIIGQLGSLVRLSPPPRRDKFL